MVEKKHLHTIEKSIKLICLLLVASKNLFSQTDTAAKKLKVPKHYFTPTVYGDFYDTKQRDLNTKNVSSNDLDLAKKLKTYQYAQVVGGFYFPILTNEKVNDDQSVSNFHLLGTGSYMLAMPRFSGISNHDLMKASLGVRGIYNSGKKGIWFFDATPFVSGDLSVSTPMMYRWASTFLYDRMVNPSFSYRLGITRTFILGNRYTLPYLGIRIGRLDKTYLSIQFPRFISFSFPMGAKVRGSIYTKATGSLLAMGNTDSLYNGTNGKSGATDKSIIFGRYDVNTGFRVDFNISKYFSFYSALGVSGKRQLAFFSNQYNAKNDVTMLEPFFREGLKGVGYINFGFTVRIGQAKSVYGNHNMYEVFNLNSSIDVGDNNTNTGDGNIPNQVKKKTISNLKTKDVQDLIEAQDLY